MRLWHKDMVNYLPRKQLLSQLRECVALSLVIEKNGTPNHMLVNKIMDYDLDEFRAYCYIVCQSMYNRNYKVADITLQKLKIERTNSNQDVLNIINKLNVHKENDCPVIFKNWHNDRYLKQCYYNLEEKFDCFGISEEEWKLLNDNINLNM